jgi:hypothetical protein
MEEVYKTIKGHRKYSISDKGNVMNFFDKVIKPRLNDKGYYRISLIEDDGRKLKTHYIHRLVAEAFIPNPDNKPFIDHIDNNPLNNNVNNLRWCTPQENSFNTSLRKTSTSGYKGVSYDKKSDKWRAKIGFNNKIIHLGSFQTKEEAVKTRANKAKELYGEFMNECEKVREEIKLIKDEKEKELEEMRLLEYELDRIIKG